AQILEQAACIAETGDRFGFRDFEAQRRRRDRRLVDELEQSLAETVRRHAASGQVDAEARQVAAGVLAQPGKQAVDHGQVEFDRQSAHFELVYEQIRRQQLPADAESAQDFAIANRLIRRLADAPRRAGEKYELA